MMKAVDLNTWARRAIYEHFSTVSWPFYAITLSIDVTRLRAVARQRGVSFYYAMIWACTHACNAIPEFRYRICDGVLMDMERTNPSFTVMRQGEQAFRIITMPWHEDLDTFCRQASERAERQTQFLNIEVESQSLIYFSCTPWFDFTSMTNERNLDTDDLIPRLSWGKFYDQDGRTMVHLALDVNHRTIDGWHIAQFKQHLEELFNQL